MESELLTALKKARDVIYKKERNMIGNVPNEVSHQRGLHFVKEYDDVIAKAESQSTSN